MNNEHFLRDYQYEAVKKMKNGCILNGGVGSGKSRTGLYYYFIQQGGNIDTGVYEKMKNPRDLYIITTAMKRDSLEFEGELAAFSMSTNPEINPYDNKIIIDSWNNVQKYKNVYGAFFIFDEDRVTGYGKWVKAFLSIANKNRWIILSATPGDDWMQYLPVFIANNFYKNKTDFTTQHVVYSPYSKFPKIDRYTGIDTLLRLRDSILIDMKFDRVTVPHHLDIFVSYDRTKYKKVMRNRWNPYQDEPIEQASQLCYILRRIVNEDESRITALLEILEKTPRAIIFYNFDYELEMLRHLFWDDDGPVDSLYSYEVGEWNGHNHQPVPDSDHWVYLVQYAAGCEGWNCIKTDTIIFFSQNYSYKVMTQAAGRIDRLNTSYVDLYYYHLKSRSGIDLAISKALSQKKQFNEKRWIDKNNLA